MSKTIIVAGYGPGISSAVAERFGKEDFAVALVARNAQRLAEGQKSLQARGIRAEVFPIDLGQPDAARTVVGRARAKLGPISVLHWNAYTNTAGDLTTSDTAAIRGVLDIAVSSFLAAVQEALPDLRAQKGAVLVTNGGLGLYDPKADEAAVSWNCMGLAVANAAKHKIVGLLSQKLKGDGVYVGEVMVNGVVKGSAWDAGNGNVEASTIAAKFWEISTARKETTVLI
jgi:short-subunit dehydrogenase